MLKGYEDTQVHLYIVEMKHQSVARGPVGLSSCSIYPRSSTLMPARRLLSAHLAASVFIGSILSHFKQTSLDCPVLSVIFINRFWQRTQRLTSIGGSGSTRISPNGDEKEIYETIATATQNIIIPYMHDVSFDTVGGNYLEDHCLKYIKLSFGN